MNVNCSSAVQHDAFYAPDVEIVQNMIHALILA